MTKRIDFILTKTGFDQLVAAQEKLEQRQEEGFSLNSVEAKADKDDQGNDRYRGRLVTKD
jgi:hypothetical protein